MPDKTETDVVFCSVTRETERAVLLENLTTGSRFWFPKGQVRLERKNEKTGEALAEIPIWLLEEREWDE